MGFPEPVHILDSPDMQQTPPSGRWRSSDPLPLWVDLNAEPHGHAQAICIPNQNVVMEEKFL